MTVHSFMSGFGYCVPPKTLFNEDIAGPAGISNDWIVSRTGIISRHCLDGGQTGTDLALAAAKDALALSGRAPEDVTHIVYATCTPDSCCPSAACTLAGKLGISGRMAVDVNAACAGFVNGMALADALVARTPSARVLLVASESLSHRCNWDDPSTAVLFGDGAGAVLVSAESSAAPAAGAGPEGRIIDVLLGSDGSKGDLLLISGGFSASPYKMGDKVGPDYFIRMQGGLVFKHAVRNMSASCLEILKRNGYSTSDVDMFVPHQANLRIIEAVGGRLGIPENKVFLNVQKYGNTSAASIPIALGEAVQSGAIKPGMLALVTTFGGGLTWGAGLLRF